MIEKRTLKATKPPTPEEIVEGMSQDALFHMRNLIDQRLRLDLEDMNMSQELSGQYLQAKNLYAAVVTDGDVPANQKAQCLNTITAIMKSIVDAAALVNSIERLKKLEAATLSAVRDLPAAPKAKFFEVFKGYLDEH